MQFLPDKNMCAMSCFYRFLCCHALDLVGCQLDIPTYADVVYIGSYSMPDGIYPMWISN